MSDLIDRQAAIDAICKHGTELERRGITVLSVANYKQATVDLLETLPSAQRTRRWIPVSERLPDDGSVVWATIKGSDVIKVEAGETIEQAFDRVNCIRRVTRAYWSEEEHGWNDPTFGCPLIVQPIAWMPIDEPEPYNEEQHDH